MNAGQVTVVGTGPVPTEERSPRKRAEASKYWYKKHARRSKVLFQVFGISALVFSAAVPVAGVFFPGNSQVTTVIGFVIVVLTGAPSLFHWGENWIRFSGAYFALSAELNLYDARAHPYDDADPAKNDAALATRVIAIGNSELAVWSKLASGKPGS